MLSCGATRKSFRNKLSFLEHNKSTVTSVINSSASHILIDILSGQIEIDVRTKPKADEKRGVIMPANLNYLAPIFTGALAYMARWWVIHDWKPSKEIIVDEAVRILKII